MMKYAMKNSTLNEIMQKKSYTTTDGELTVKSTISNTARRNGLNIEYILGGKTGTTGDAGICLASFSKDENGPELICIVTGANMYSSKPYNIIDTEYLYGEIIENYSYQSIINKGDIFKSLPTICAKQDSVDIVLKNDVKIYVDNIEKDKIELKYDGLEEVDYKLEKGTEIGTIHVLYDSELIQDISVTLDEELEFSLIKWIKLNRKAILMTSAILLALIVIMKIILSKRKK